MKLKILKMAKKSALSPPFIHTTPQLENTCRYEEGT